MSPHMPNLNSIPDPSLWAKKGIVTLRHVVLEGPFQVLKRAYALPVSFQFRYWQLRHAFEPNFLNP